MLIRALILTAVVLALATCEEAQSQQLGVTRTGLIMSDPLPYGNRFGFPFTREEYKRALVQVRSEEDAEFFVRMIYEPDKEVTGITFGDLDLLLLASLSPGLATRVTEYAPRLRERVREVLADPSFLRALRKAEAPGPGEVKTEGRGPH